MHYVYIPWYALRDFCVWHFWLLNRLCRWNIDYSNSILKKSLCGFNLAIGKLNGIVCRKKMTSRVKDINTLKKLHLYWCALLQWHIAMQCIRLTRRDSISLKKILQEVKKASPCNLPSYQTPRARQKHWTLHMAHLPKQESTTTSIITDKHNCLGAGYKWWLQYNK